MNTAMSTATLHDLRPQAAARFAARVRRGSRRPEVEVSLGEHVKHASSPTWYDLKRKPEAIREATKR